MFNRVAACLFLVALSALAPAQTSNPRSFDATAFGRRIELGPEWLFSPGDNLAWASPSFDDSHWRIVSAREPLSHYGIQDIPYAWYRIHIHLRPGVSDLTVGTERVFGSYEIYANGVRIGSAGRIAGIPVYAQRNLVSIPVPARLISPQGDLVLAFRFALEATGPLGRGKDTPIGPTDGGSSIYLMSAESAARSIGYVDAHNTVFLWALACLSLLIGLVALALFTTMRSQKEYLACAVFLLAETGYLLAYIAQLLRAHAQTSTAVRYTFVGIVNVALIEFIRLVLRIPRSRWLLGLEIASFVTAYAGVILDLGLAPWSFAVVALYLPDLIVLILLPILLTRACLRNNREAWVLLPAVLLRGLDRYWGFFHILPRLVGLAANWNGPPTLHVVGYPVALRSFDGFIFFITILLFLVVRTVSIARQHAHAADELEAARSVQQVLIPEQIPVIPGFVVQSVYKPAGQVGGDFFQILPLSQGGVLVAIGDVSGKGMPAAMMVSLLVGKLQTLTEFTSSPAEILKGLNRHLQTRSRGGFTTCLVLRADPNGILTLANAGHLAPYLSGSELAIENGLPLGLTADPTYVESSLQLKAGDRLTLLTDGVVEARSITGELFGFERTAAISSESAETIAAAAQQFGQEDDITVLTVQYAPAEVLHA